MNLFLANRFFRNNSQRKRKASIPAIHIATLGIALGLVVMILSVCVVRGFKFEITNKLTGFASHIEILDINSFSSPESYPISVNPKLISKISHLPSVEKVQYFSEKMGILKTDNDFQAVSIKGIGENYDTSFIAQSIISGKMPELSDSTPLNDIIISKMMSDALNLRVGDRVFAYFFENTVKMRRFRVSAVYQTNLKQFDKTFVLTNLASVNQLNGWNTTQTSCLEVRLNNMKTMTSATSQVRALLKNLPNNQSKSYYVLPLTENPRTASVLNWLGLLDMNIWVILILVALVAAFSMISGLLILILERTNTIGVLKAMGATNARVRHIFLLYALMIVGRGLLIGNTVGLILVWFQYQFGMIKLDPATYYVSAVPVDVNVGIILLLNVATVLITLLAMLGPSFMISRIQPAKAIRTE